MFCTKICLDTGVVDPGMFHYRGMSRLLSSVAQCKACLDLKKTERKVTYYTVHNCVFSEENDFARGADKPFLEGFHWAVKLQTLNSLRQNVLFRHFDVFVLGDV